MAAWVKAVCAVANQPGPWRAAERREQEAAFRDPLNHLCQKPLRYARAETFANG